MREIYFDEAGFTGNNLTDNDQPFFAFAAVQITDFDAQQYLHSIRTRFGIHAAELKGGRLCRRASGHPVVARILKDHSASVKVVLCNKAFSLAAKLFEYLVEPIISPVNTAFYDRDFHKFVANGLYLQGQARDGGAEAFLKSFQEVMVRQFADGDFMSRDQIFVADGQDFSRQIYALVSCHPEKVREELESLRDTPIGRWSLDLSATAIWGLLRAFGTDMKPIRAFVDASKPLDDQKHCLESLIGRQEQATIHIFGATRPVLFSLAEPVNVVDSAVTPGIQIADIFASATVYAIKNPTSEVGRAWTEISESILCEESILPDEMHFDLSQPRAKANAVVLHGLIERSIRGDLCIADWPDILSEIDSRFEL